MDVFIPEIPDQRFEFGILSCRARWRA